MAETLREGGSVGLSVDGEDHTLGPDDVQMVLQPLEGYQVERAGTHAVALNLELTTSCAARGSRARSCTPCRPRARTPASTSRTGSRSGSGATTSLIDAVRAHEGYVSAETLATSLELDGADGEPAAIEGRELLISVEKR